MRNGGGGGRWNGASLCRARRTSTEPFCVCENNPRILLNFFSSKSSSRSNITIYLNLASVRVYLDLDILGAP